MSDEPTRGRCPASECSYEGPLSGGGLCPNCFAVADKTGTSLARGDCSIHWAQSRQDCACNQTSDEPSDEELAALELAPVARMPPMFRAMSTEKRRRALYNAGKEAGRASRDAEVAGLKRQIAELREDMAELTGGSDGK